MSLTQRQLLHLIEGLTIVYENGPKTHEEAEKMINSIYKCSHMGIDNCKNKHEEWMEKAGQLYNALEKNGILKCLVVEENENKSE